MDFDDLSDPCWFPCWVCGEVQLLLVVWAFGRKDGRKKTRKEGVFYTHEPWWVDGLSIYAALAYFDKLKPSCIDAGVSYEDRVARRKEEIESLQQALRILNGEDNA